MSVALENGMQTNIVIGDVRCLNNLFVFFATHSSFSLGPIIYIQDMIEPLEAVLRLDRRKNGTE